MKNKRFDLNMNSWGPYNKEYLGVCHIADKELGASFNVELFPGFFRRKILASHSGSDTGLKMWGANANLTRFSYRYELEWRDAVYCDVDFVITDDTRCDISCTFVNNTDLPQSVNMNLCASLQYPALKSGSQKIGYRLPYEAILPNGCRFVDALDYDYIVCAETLASDGRYLAEDYKDGATGMGTVVSADYFFSEEHYLKYRINESENTVLIRYISSKDTNLTVSVDEKKQTVSLPRSNEFSVVTVELPEHKGGAVFEIRPTGDKLTIDSLVFGDNAEKTVFRPINRSVEAKRVIDGNKMTLYYEGIKQSYTIKWHEPCQMVRRYYYDDIGYALSLRIHNHVSEVLANEKSFSVYENVLSEPLFLVPGEKKTLSFTVSSGEAKVTGKSPELYSVSSNSDGKPYVFSQNMMAYNTFLNVVYPIYTRRGYIRHNTPGRLWDSLYSWDSGFIGLGLASADFERAFDCLNTYLTPVGDIHSPYIFHGSVVPTQVFLYQYLFNKFPGKRERLKGLYPMVKQLFDFYAKRDTTEGQMKSGLIKTFDIFYNSGGWDDYPAQVYVHSQKPEGVDIGAHNTTPVITSAITVLIAKILRSIAEEFEIDDIADYDEAISKYSSAILKHTWCEEVGYFSYLVHDELGNPKEFLKYKDGTIYNCGFDGIYPYIASVTNSGQEKRIVENIKNGLLTETGISVVDTRAPYYRTDGYWNGSVWMPHQWILWRALFDHGEGELAFKIADTALRVWKREVDESYCCFENFMIANGRGSGFHQFSGLSTPVLLFFESYYKPGTVTLGFSSNVLSEEWNEDKTALTLRCISAGRAPIAVICLAEGKKYRFVIGEREISARQLTCGAYELDLPNGECFIKVKNID